jgi:hypothetical protein
VRKLALLAVFVSGLAVPGIAAAATPQGQLTGTGAIGGFAISISTPVKDGGTSDVGLENDYSGTCAGDTGVVERSGFVSPIVCAHYVVSSGCCNAGSPKMRFAYPNVAGTYTVVRITDNGASPDSLGVGTTNDLLLAQAWVQKGAQGAGLPFSVWNLSFVGVGNFTVTP